MDQCRFESCRPYHLTTNLNRKAKRQMPNSYGVNDNLYCPTTEELVEAVDRVILSGNFIYSYSADVRLGYYVSFGEGLYTPVVTIAAPSGLTTCQQTSIVRGLCHHLREYRQERGIVSHENEYIVILTTRHGGSQDVITAYPWSTNQQAVQVQNGEVITAIREARYREGPRVRTNWGGTTVNSPANFVPSTYLVDFAVIVDDVYQERTYYHQEFVEPTVKKKTKIRCREDIPVVALP